MGDSLDQAFMCHTSDISVYTELTVAIIERQLFLLSTLHFPAWPEHELCEHLEQKADQTRGPLPPKL